MSQIETKHYGNATSEGDREVSSAFRRCLSLRRDNVELERNYEGFRLQCLSAVSQFETTLVAWYTQFAGNLSPVPFGGVSV